MNTAPRYTATTEKKPQNQAKNPTQPSQILLLQSSRLGTTHIFVIVGKKFGCLRRSLPARYTALTLSHPSHPSLPGTGVVLSLLPPRRRLREGDTGWAVCWGGKSREQAAL